MSPFVPTPLELFVGRCLKILPSHIFFFIVVSLVEVQIYFNHSRWMWAFILFVSFSELEMRTTRTLPLMRMACVVTCRAMMINIIFGVKICDTVSHKTSITPPFLLLEFHLIINFTRSLVNFTGGEGCWLKAGPHPQVVVLMCTQRCSMRLHLGISCVGGGFFILGVRPFGGVGTTWKSNLSLIEDLFQGGEHLRTRHYFWRWHHLELWVQTQWVALVL